VFGSKIDRIVKRLRSPALDVRVEAANRLLWLAGSRLPVKEGIKALTAAAGTFPPLRYDSQDASASLLRAVHDDPYPDYIPVIARLYSQYSERARPFALRILSQLHDRCAAEALVTLVETHGWPKDCNVRVTLSFSKSPRHAEVLFPSLLRSTRGSDGEYEMYSLCREYCRAGLLDRAQLRGLVDPLMEAYRPRKAHLVPAQRSEGVGWMWEQDYQVARRMASVVLDLFGFVDAPEARNELPEALGYRDPRLKTSAICSLLRQGETVDPRHFDDAAASHETRNSLYDSLTDLGKVELFPQRFLTQEAFACSEMVNWLCSPNRLGREPDGIELMKTTSIRVGEPDEFIDYYVFRFRTFPPHRTAATGWMAGFSGPFLRRESPTTHSYGATFSGLEPWDSKTPEQHVGSNSTLLEEWHKIRAERTKA
jgi:hypothetical protein